MSERIASLYAEIGADTSGLQRGISQASNLIVDMVTNMGNMSTAAIAGAAALAGLAVAVGAAKTVFDLSREGASIQRLIDAGDSLAASMGSNMDTIVASVREASMGMVSDLDIIKAANRAMMLGVSSSASEMAELMRVAAFRARAMGADTTSAFNDITLGIGRLSPKILDNLGIVIDTSLAYDEYAKSLGKAGATLTDTEKRTALLNAVIKQGNSQIAAAGGLTLDAAGQFERMDAAISNASDAFKAQFAPAATAAADALYYLIEGTRLLADQQSAIAGSATSYGEYVIAATKAAVATKQITQADADAYLAQMKLGVSAEATATLVDAYTEAQYNAARAAALANKLNEDGSKALFMVYTGATQATGAINAYNSGLKGLSDTFSGDLSRAFVAAENTLARAAKLDFTEALGSAISGLSAGGGLASSIGNYLSNLDYALAGGIKLEQTTNAIMKNLDLSPAQQQELLKSAAALATNMSVAAGDTTKWQAMQDLAKNLGITTAEAAALMKTAGTDVQAFADTASAAMEKASMEQGDVNLRQEWLDLGIEVDLTGKKAAEALDRMGLQAMAAQGQVMLLVDAIKAIPTSVKIDIQINTTGTIPQMGGAGYTGPYSGYSKYANSRRASGGMVMGGNAYTWNESGSGPEIFVPSGNGYILNQKQAQKALAGSLGAGKGRGGGMVVNNSYHDTYVVMGGSAATATALAIASNARRSRLNASMGV